MGHVSYSYLEKGKVMSRNFDGVLNYISGETAALLYMVDRQIKNKTSEIRLRADKSLALTVEGKNYFLNKRGMLLDKVTNDCCFIEKAKLNESYMLVCNNSVYAHEEELSKGFVTLPNGSRVGIFGETVYSCGRITAYKNITSLNYRIPRQIIGCALPIKNIAETSKGVIICGPPASSKTTTLRDLVRMLADGECNGYKRVCVIDSRNEISAVCNGKSTMDLGECCDILNIPDTEIGIETAIRVMNPEYIAVDEIMSEREIQALIRGINCGVKLILTAHVGEEEEIFQKESIKRLVKAGGIEDAIFIKSTFATPKLIKLNRVN